MQPLDQPCQKIYTIFLVVSLRAESLHLTTFSPSRWGWETASSLTSVFPSASWPQSPTAVRRSLHSHSSAVAGHSPPVQVSPEAQCRQDERGPLPSPTLHPIRRGNKAFFNHSAKPSDVGGKSKSTCKAPDHASDRPQGQPLYKKHALPILLSSPLRSYKPMEHITPLKLPINEVFNTSKDQP